MLRYLQIDELLAKLGEAGRGHQVPSTGMAEDCSERYVRMLKKRDSRLVHRGL
jgi:hypothetical protein